MKKYLLLVACLVVAAMSYSQETAVNQSEETCQAQLAAYQEKAHIKRVFGNNFHINLGYSFQSLKLQHGASATIDNKTNFKAKYAGTIGLTGTIRLHKKPVKNIVSFGLDLGLDITGAMHKEGTNYSLSEMLKHWADTYQPIMPGSNLGFGEIRSSKKGIEQVELGIAIGPRIDVAPFWGMGEKLEPLRFFAYGHFLPSVSCFIRNFDEQYASGSHTVNDMSIAFAPLGRVGAGIQYRYISLAYECRLGVCSYKVLDVAVIATDILGMWDEKWSNEYFDAIKAGKEGEAEAILEQHRTEYWTKMQNYSVPDAKYNLVDHRIVLGINF